MTTILADTLVVVHLRFVVFVMTGGFLLAHWLKLVWLHLPAAAWGAFIEFTGGVCPLTPLENHLRVLRVDTSASVEGSVTRQLADLMLHELEECVPGLSVTSRDVAADLPFVDAAWVDANLPGPGARDAAQCQALAGSDELVAELMAADVLLIATLLYNFGVPASLKAWIDQIAGARLTFRYNEHGPEGMLSGKRAYIFVATGGTEVGSAIDFATPWLKFVLGFLGITDVEVVAADRGMLRSDATRRRAAENIVELLARDWPALAEAV